MSVEAQDGVAGSTLELYREVIDLRKRQLMGSGGFEWADGSGGSLAFDRGEVRVIVNFGGDPMPIPRGEVLVASVPIEDGLLPSDGAVWVRPGVG
jgi:alpha-glucosidase